MSESGEHRKFDLEDRTAKFSEQIIAYAQKIPRGPVNDPVIRQLVKSATSVGANYCEADDACSKKDFHHKIGICRKEARETKYWLRMVAKAHPDGKCEARHLWSEARQLHLIFAKIFKSSSGSPS
jgi:four helix bundle protein